MKYYKNAIGCKGDRIKIKFNGDGLVARNGRRVKTANGILINLDDYGYIVFPYGTSFKGISLEDLGRTHVRWNNDIDRWDINIASSRANKAEIIDNRLSDEVKSQIKAVTKGNNFIHKNCYDAPTKRMVNGVKPYAMDLADVVIRNSELYTWIDETHKEFVYNLDEDQRKYYIGVGCESGFKFTIKGGRSKTLECVRGLFDGDDVYAFVDENDYVRLIPAELIDSPITYKDADGYFTTLRTAKELTTLMENAKVFERSEDVADSLKYGMKNYTGLYGDVSIKAIIDIMGNFAWFRRIGYQLKSSSDNTMLISLHNVFDDAC